MSSIALADEYNTLARQHGWHAQADGAMQFERGELGLAAKIWGEAAGDRAAPLQEELTPRLLVPILRNVTFIQRTADESGAPRYRFRFFGSTLVQVTGDCTGRFLDEVIPMARIGSWTGVYDAVIRSLQPLRVTSWFEIPHLAHLRGESFTAPLATADGTPWGIFSVTYFSSK